ETVVRTMAQHCQRPIILPLSNPTRLAEAAPEDLLRWTDGRALVATGSPFEPVTIGRVTYVVGQANNALVFPGLGLGVIVARAARVAERTLLAGIRPLLVPSRPEDPEQKIGFQDNRWIRVPGGQAATDVADDAVYLVISLRNVVSGLAVLHGWRFHPQRMMGE